MFVLAVCQFLIPGCATVSPANAFQTKINQSEKFIRNRYYFGFVRVQTQNHNNDVFVQRATGLGVSVGEDFTIGLFDELRGSLPSDCRVVIFVRSEKDLALIKSYITNDGENLCMLSGISSPL